MALANGNLYTMSNLYYDGTSFRYLGSGLNGSYMSQYLNSFSWYLASGNNTAGSIPSTGLGAPAMALDTHATLSLANPASSGSNYAVCSGCKVISSSSTTDLVEVKSGWTYDKFGADPRARSINLAKKEACISAGYKFEFWIF